MHTITLPYINTYVNTYTDIKINTYARMHTQHRMLAMSIFGNNLRRAREAADLTQEEMAARINMQRTNYVKLETKGKCGNEIMERIASVSDLGLTDETLKAWRAIDEYGDSVIIEAFKILTDEQLAKAIPPQEVDRLLELAEADAMRRKQGK